MAILAHQEDRLPLKVINAGMVDLSSTPNSVPIIYPGLPPTVVPKRKLGKADNRHESPCYCMAVS